MWNKAQLYFKRLLRIKSPCPSSLIRIPRLISQASSDESPDLEEGWKDDEMGEQNEINMSREMTIKYVLCRRNADIPLPSSIDEGFSKNTEWDEKRKKKAEDDPGSENLSENGEFGHMDPHA